MNLSSPKSYRVVKYLLGNRISSQTEISNETGVAIGYVNEVVHELFDLNMVNIGYGKCTLIDHVKLLEKISFDRKFKKLLFKEFRLPTSSIKDTEVTLVNFCESRNVEYAFSVFSALKHYYEYHINYPTVHIYVKNPIVITELEKGEGVIPVIVLKPDRQDILKDSTKRNNQKVCDKIQLVIDLYSSGIGRDAAIKFYRDSIWKNEIF